MPIFSDAGFHHSPAEVHKHKKAAALARAHGVEPLPLPPKHYTVRVICRDGGHVSTWHVLEDVSASSEYIPCLISASTNLVV